MNYLVCIKQVPETTTRFQIKEGRADLSSVKWIINPYDEFALEQALRLAEKDPNSLLSVLSLGPARCQEALRTALAMGADEAFHIETDKRLDSFAAAEALFSFIQEKMKEKNWRLIFCGSHSIDYGNSAAGPMLASLLGWPSVSPVNQVLLKEENLEIKRPLEQGGFEVLHIKAPALCCMTKGMNEPRYPSLAGIMKAKSKPLTTLCLPDEIKSFVSLEKEEPLKERPPVQMIEGSPQEQAEKLIEILRNKEKVIG